MWLWSIQIIYFNGTKSCLRVSFPVTQDQYRVWNLPLTKITSNHLPSSHSLAIIDWWRTHDRELKGLFVSSLILIVNRDVFFLYYKHVGPRKYLKVALGTILSVGKWKRQLTEIEDKNFCTLATNLSLRFSVAHSSTCPLTFPG